MTGPVQGSHLRVIEGGKGRRRTIWCERLPGFGVRHYKSGRSNYVVQAGIGGTQRTVTLGRTSVLSEHQARDVARRILLRAQVGENPADDRQRVRRSPTFADFIGEYWRRMTPRWKPSTRVRNDEHRRCHIAGSFVGRSVDVISAAEVQRWFVALSDRCGPGAANRALAVVSAMFKCAIAWGHRADGDNPCVGIKRNAGLPAGRVVEPAELARLGAVLDAASAQQLVSAAAIRLLLLTGCRRSEVLALRWRDWRGDLLMLADAKAGPRTVWLGEEAQRLLAGLPQRPDQIAIFANDATGGPRRSIDRFWRKLREQAGIADTRLHDLRHTFASHAARGAETMLMIGRLLGHRHTGSTARYAHLDDRALLNASATVGDLIVAAIGEATMPEGHRA